MILLLGSAAAALLLAVLLFAAGVQLTAPLSAGRDYLALAYGIGTLGAASLLSFVAYWMHPVAGSVVGALLVLGSVAVLVVGRAWRSWRLAVSPTLMTLGVLALYITVLCMWSPSDTSFAIVTSHLGDLGLPIDNVIPFLFSDRLAAGISSGIVTGDWHGSDRPPLQTGLLLIERAVLGPFGLASVPAVGASIVAQALWIPALFSALRASGVTRTVGWITVSSVALVGTVFVNTVYTWPKLMSAAMVLAAVTLLIDAIRRPAAFRVDIAVAVVLFVFGTLAHGAAAFAAPLVIALGIAAIRRQTAAGALRGTAGAAVAGVIVYLPWLLYQRLADPPGDRLIKWHLAGSIGIDDRSAVQTLIDSYSSLTPAEWLTNRITNLQTIVHPALLEGAGSPFSRRSAEFFITTTSLGVTLPLLLSILVAVVVRRSWRQLPNRLLLFAVAGSVASILLWSLLMFVPGSTIAHQGSHVWVLVLAAAPIAWLGRRHRRIVLAVIALQVVLFALVYLPEPTPGPLSAAAVAVALGGAVSMTAAVVLSRPRRTPTFR